MIYEIRVYEAVVGKAEAMRQRFKMHAVPLLPKHGIELIGVFEAPEEDNLLTYLTRFNSEDDRAAAGKNSAPTPNGRRSRPPRSRMDHFSGSRRSRFFRRLWPDCCLADGFEVEAAL
jgi:hypothetical protein